MPLDSAKKEAVSVVQSLFLFPQEDALSYFWVSRAKHRDSTVVTDILTEFWREGSYGNTPFCKLQASWAENRGQPYI